MLARSLKGGVEQLLKDGEIVAGRHVFDNKLAFAMLRRLDRQAELGATFATPARADVPVPAPAVKGQWQDLLDALSKDRETDAHTLLESPKVDSEVDNPPVEGVEGDDMANDDAENLPDPRIWWDSAHKAYRTNFPPPEGADCFQQERFGHRDYQRDLTEAEAALLTTRDEAAAARRRAADEEERAAFFAGLVAEEVPPLPAAPTPPPEEGRSKNSKPLPRHFLGRSRLQGSNRALARMECRRKEVTARLTERACPLLAPPPRGRGARSLPST